MSAEPNRSIDDQLRAFARQRRAGLEPAHSLPPSLRASIREEAARQRAARLEHPVPAGRPLAQLWQALWPRFAVAGALTVFLAIAATSWFPKPYDQSITTSRSASGQNVPESLSRTEPPSAAAEGRSYRLPVAPPAPVAAPPLQPPPNLADAPAAMVATRETPRPGATAAAPPAQAKMSPPAGAATLAADAAPAPVTVAKAELTTPTVETRDPSPSALNFASAPATTPPIQDSAPNAETTRQLALARPAAAPRPGNEIGSLPAPASGNNGGTPWTFTRTNPAQRLRRNVNSPPTPNVLTRFQLHQSGARLWIVDADGSTYDGGGTPDIQPPNGVGSRPVPGATIAFQVVGTNRTSKSRVVLAGRITPSTPNTPAILQATAILNGGVEIPIEARAVSP